MIPGSASRWERGLVWAFSIQAYNLGVFLLRRVVLTTPQGSTSSGPSHFLLY